MKCYVCGRGLDQVALFRQNPKGQLGIWACEDCNKQPIDPEVAEIVKIIQEKRDAE